MKEIIEVTDFGGEPVAYFVEGHDADLMEFARAVDARAAIDDVTDLDILRETRREWWRSVPCDCGDHGEHFVRSHSLQPYAQPVTVWHCDGEGWLSAPPESSSSPSSVDGGGKVGEG